MSDLPKPNRRQALTELQRVGPIYAALNVLAPLVRLAAMGTFAFGTSSAYRKLLGAVMATIAVGVIRPALFTAGGAIASKTVGVGLLGEGDATDGGSETLASSLFHQTRLVWSQVLRAGLLGLILVAWAAATSLDAVRVGYRDLPGEPHGHGGHVFPGNVPLQVGVGTLAFVAMSLVWEVAHRRSPREQLASEAPNDLSSANEDELLRGMRPGMRRISLSARCLSVALETSVDILLLFVFLPSALEGLDPPSPSALRTAPGLAVLTSIVYGSQHLRFRGEWLLCAIHGLGLGYLCIHFEGSTLATLIAGVTFAVFRHWRRTGQDVRRAHTQ